MEELQAPASGRSWIACCGVSGLLLAAVVAITFFVPTESTMGDVQRILYIHVPVAWVGLMAILIAAAAGIAYLTTTNLRWDHWAQAAVELGWLFCGLTLVTGSIWAHAAWGTWWTWDPRLTTSFVLWLIYSGCLVARAGIQEDHHRARISAVLACLGAIDVPLVVLATRWFRGIHPVAPEMEPIMRMVLMFSVLSFSAIFVLLLCRRSVQVKWTALIRTAQLVNTTVK